MSWHQRERGLVYLLSFVTSFGTSLFCWGGLVGWGFLSFCFLTHTAAYLDLVRQRAFPVFRPRASLIAAVLGFGLTVYLPIGLLLHSYALVATTGDESGVSYLVNCLAYQENDPALGQHVWMRLSARSTPMAGQVLAVAGQEVEWTGRIWRVDGKVVHPARPGSLPCYPTAWGFQVPPNHVLIEPDAGDSSAASTTSLALVSRQQIMGRAWARYYPIWDRCLL